MILCRPRLYRSFGSWVNTKQLIHRAEMSTAEQAVSKPQWQDEKKKFLSLAMHDKRKVYRCGSKFFTLSDIKTWHDFVLDYKKLAPKIPLLPNHKLDQNVNIELTKKVSIYRGDITTLEVDAIVNAANKSLEGGGGVDGAIHRAAGPFLLAENRTLGGCEVGEAKLSGGYQLPAKYVISTVGPRGEKPDFLRNCYKNSLDLLVEKQLHSIAFPCISTGIYGYPLKPAAHVAVMAVRKHLEENFAQIERVIFCLFSETDEEIYQGILQSYFPLN
ncbi:PREDICTED: macro domain-containing protein CT2219-like [Nicrophorus vespilloides]|uniref:Macro domain-containing protein CT2219-like n=1 Tax=Nicrophorus vespilloides TaxID=110193 RepID=A0ABM1NKB7_NICVS|nr:PREDICTED: macro domain-containing protein CT2219-like [Nicrophorus vespilloides]